MHVLHVGVDPCRDGGMASVVQRHLSRNLDGVTCAPLPAINQNETNLWRRYRPALSAAWVVLRRQPSKDLMFHFHLSERGSLLREGGLAVLAHIRGHRGSVATLHGSGTLTMGIAQRFVLGKVLARCAIVHVLSSRHAEALASVAAPLVLIPNDVELPDSVLPASARNRTVLFAGELGLRKGLDLLLAAWPRVASDGWTLELCGPEAAGEASMVQGLFLHDRTVHVRGRLDHEAILASMSTAAIVVLPSRAEALPMSLCEAMAAGCAIVATDVGGTCDLLGLDNPYLIPSGDKKALEEALVALVNDSEERERQGVANRKRAEVLFSPPAIAQAWMRVYANSQTGHASSPMVPRPESFPPAPRRGKRGIGV
jgi:glycosyltransferase involved in cell wall biosynthesis